MLRSKFGFTRIVQLLTALTVALSVLVVPTQAQPCGGQWLPGEWAPGVGGNNPKVFATIMWDPDGPGPLPAELVAGGNFTTAGGVSANKIARWNGTAWLPLGTGLNGDVCSLAVLPNGDLIAGGSFTSAGGVSASRIARWNGTTWSPLGTGKDSTVLSLAVLPNGDLIAGCAYTTEIGNPATNVIARWNGTTWLPFGTGVAGSIWSLVVLPDGNLVAGGGFTNTGGVARWNGTSWSPIGTGMNGAVRAMVLLQNGDLVAGGGFTTAGGVNANFIARWNGTSWSPLGTGVSGTSNSCVYALAVLPNGNLVAGGEFASAGSIAVNKIALWDGESWSSLGSGIDRVSSQYVYTLAVLPSGDLIAGGGFVSAGGVGVNGIARWNGSVWSPLGAGASNYVFASTLLPNGELIVGGRFTTAGGVSVNGVARWNGTDWSPLGTGLSGTTNFAVRSLTSLPNGDLVAGGEFTTAGGVSANRIARWNGTTWSPLGTGMNNTVSALVAQLNGDLIAGGGFTNAGGVNANMIARWNGMAWSPLGTGVSVGSILNVNALAVMPNGDLIAGGGFERAGGVSANRIARWNGTNWSPLGSGMMGLSLYYAVYALAVLQNGDLVAAGDFVSSGGVSTNGIARWNGTAWSPLGTGMNYAVRSLAVLPNGDLIAGGEFSTAGGVNANRIARWNGTAWSPMGTGMGGALSPWVHELAVLPNGELVAGGEFVTAGPNTSAYFARWTETNIPPVALPPQPQTLAAGQTLILTSSPTNGYANVSVQWQRNGINIINGPGGASPGGGTVSGASAPLASPTRQSTAMLAITGAQASDTGQYTAIFSNACGSTTSIAATITVTPLPCPADFNNDSIVDFFDYLDFVAAFAASGPGSDFNADTVVDFFDYLDFVEAFAAGC